MRLEKYLEVVLKPLRIDLHELWPHVAPGRYWETMLDLIGARGSYTVVVCTTSAHPAPFWLHGACGEWMVNGCLDVPEVRIKGQDSSGFFFTPIY